MWRECIQISEALSMHQSIYCQAIGTPPWDRSSYPQWGWTLPSGSVTVLGSTAIPSACVDLHPESPLHLPWVTRLSHNCCWSTQFQSFHMPPSQKSSSGAKSQGSCLEYLWHGAREDWAGDRGEYLLKSHKTFLVNQNSGNYSACWPGLGIYHDLGHPFK